MLRRWLLRVIGAALALAVVSGAILFLTSFFLDWPIDGGADKAEAQFFRADLSLPGRAVPYEFHCKGDGDLSVTLRWSDDGEAQGEYLAEILQDGELLKLELPGGDFFPASKSTTGQSLFVGPLKPERMYGYRVWSRDENRGVWAGGEFRTPRCAEITQGCPPDQAIISHGPIVGATTSSSARLWIRACTEVSYQFQYKLSTEPWEQAMLSERRITSAASDHASRVDITGLQPNTRYDYRVVLYDSVILPALAGAFTTMPPDDGPAALTFLVGADINQDMSDAIFRQALLDRPLFALLIGDQVYTDSYGFLSPKGKVSFEGLYRKSWGTQNFREFMSRVPTYMMWDDHELQDDWDRGSTAKFYQYARAAYDEYQGLHNPDPVEPTVTYYSFRAGPAEFFVMDVRSYRSPIRHDDNASKTMLGDAQKAALKRWLESSSATFKFIVSPVAFTDLPLNVRAGREPVRDHWDGYLTERNEIFDFIRDQGISGVTLLSGDIHATGIFRHEPWGLLEFNTTPMTQTSPAAIPFDAEDPQVLFAASGERVYGLITIDTTGPTPVLRLRVRNASDQTTYDQTFEVTPP